MVITGSQDMSSEDFENLCLSVRDCHDNTLHITGASFSRAQLKRIFTEINRNPTITHLAISRCEFMRGIQFTNDEIRDSGETLADFLSNNRTLTSVDLKGQSLSDSACEKLGTMLGKNTTLQEFSVDNLRYPNETGLGSLLVGLQYNRTLRHFSGQGCALPLSVTPALINNLQNHPTLTQMDLPNLEISPGEKDSPREMLETATFLAGAISKAPPERHINLSKISLESYRGDHLNATVESQAAAYFLQNARQTREETFQQNQGHPFTTTIQTAINDREQKLKANAGVTAMKDAKQEKKAAPPHTFFGEKKGKDSAASIGRDDLDDDFEHVRASDIPPPTKQQVENAFAKIVDTHFLRSPTVKEELPQKQILSEIKASVSMLKKYYETDEKKGSETERKNAAGRNRIAQALDSLSEDLARSNVKDSKGNYVTQMRDVKLRLSNAVTQVKRLEKDSGGSGKTAVTQLSNLANALNSRFSSSYESMVTTSPVPPPFPRT